MTRDFSGSIIPLLLTVPIVACTGTVDKSSSRETGRAVGGVRRAGLAVQNQAGVATVPAHDIVQAATDGLAIFVKNKPGARIGHFGFASQADIDSAELGAGFQLFTIQPDLLNASTSLDFQNLVTPINQWWFPIVVGGVNKALLTVALIEGKWTPVGIGASRLGAALAGLTAAWPQAAGYAHRFIRVYQAESDFVEMSQDGSIMGIVPLSSLLRAQKENAELTFDAGVLRGQEEILSDLRAAISQH